MVLNFEDRGYINIDDIKIMRWFPEQDGGIVVVNNAKISVAAKEYDLIEKAYIQNTRSYMYDKDMKKKRGI